MSVSKCSTITGLKFKCKCQSNYNSSVHTVREILKSIFYTKYVPIELRHLNINTRNLIKTIQLKITTRCWITESKKLSDERCTIQENSK